MFSFMTLTPKIEWLSIQDKITQKYIDSYRYIMFRLYLSIYYIFNIIQTNLVLTENKVTGE